MEQRGSVFPGNHTKLLGFSTGSKGGHTHTLTRQFLNLHLSVSDWFRLFLTYSPALTGYLTVHRSSLCLITISGFIGMNPHVRELVSILVLYDSQLFVFNLKVTGCIL